MGLNISDRSRCRANRLVMLPKTDRNHPHHHSAPGGCSGCGGRRCRGRTRAHVCGPRPLHGLPVARRVGCALARDRLREPRSICGPVVDVQRAPPRPAPGSTRRHPLRLPCPPERVARRWTGRPRRERYWLLIELGDTEICKTNPGLDEDLYITADAEAFVKWHAGQLTWAQATREDRIQLDGSPSLVRAFPTWNARSMFAHIRPVSRTATSPAG